MHQVTIEELESLLIRINNMDCDSSNENCQHCPLYFSGLCKEIGDTVNLILG